MTTSRLGKATGLDYDDALRRLMGLPDFERSAHRPGHAVFKLERMNLLLRRLGSPHVEVPTVHIAGTKGKGSTAAMVASMLTAGGYRTGLYTSPHLHSAVERIRVGLEPIERNEFAALVEQSWPALEWVGAQGGTGPVTFFELITAMALLYFKQTSADFQVMEVGLGGRLDATNVVSPEVSVITTISLDHVSTLGDTLALIANEKAGIIKPGVPVVVAPQHPEARDVFLRVSADRRAPLVQIGKDVSWRKARSDLDGQSFDVTGLRGSYDAWIPLLGDHQLENAATAIAAVETLVGGGLALPDESMMEGLRSVRWEGRLQLIRREGVRVVVDGAHNPHSLRRLVQALRAYFEFQRVILIFGANSGHSAEGMMEEAAMLSPTVVAVRSRHPRSASTRIVAGVADHHGLPVVLESEDVGLATQHALRMAGARDLVVGTGSLSVVAEIIEELQGIEPELYPYLKRPSTT